jgi:hypothetical protein
MSQYDEGAPDTNERATSRRVQTVLQQMHEERQSFLRGLQAGMLSERDYLRFQAVILDVVEELRPFQSRVSEEWADATQFEQGLDVLPLALQPRKVHMTSEKGFGRAVVEQTTKPPTLDPDHLRIISEQLDEIASEIGFEPAPSVDPGDVDGGII